MPQKTPRIYPLNMDQSGEMEKRAQKLRQQIYAAGLQTGSPRVSFATVLRVLAEMSIGLVNPLESIDCLRDEVALCQLHRDTIVAELEEMIRAAIPVEDEGRGPLN